MMRVLDALPMGRSTTLDRLQRAPSVEELHREFPGLELPVLSLGTIFVSDESVAVSGAVGSDVAQGAELTVNGHRVPVTAWGSFCAVVRLQGQSGLKLSLKTEGQRTVTLEVALKAR